MRLVWGEVVRVTEERDGLQRLIVSVDGAVSPAVCYPALSGRCSVGERVLVNATSLDLRLGTGGFHVVVAREGSGVVLDDPSGGHIMKLRYTPLQRDVLACEEHASTYAERMATADDLGGMPVVCCPLHSHVLLVAAAVKERRPAARLAYIMTDEAALPLALSDSVARMGQAGLIDTTVTAGQAFGGAIEAVSLHSGLLAARHVAEADAAIVAIGPGIAGTASTFGHGGVAVGEAINAVSVLGGEPIAALRISFADERARHFGVSHHSLVALGRVALAPTTIAVPRLGGEQSTIVDQALESAGVWRVHRRVDVDVPGLPDTRGIPPVSMGRSPQEDPAFFAAAAAAGIVAAEMLAG